LKYTIKRRECCHFYSKRSDVSNANTVRAIAYVWNKSVYLNKEELILKIGANGMQDV